VAIVVLNYVKIIDTLSCSGRDGMHTATWATPYFWVWL
jgi:hypothetical protein